MSKVTFTIGDVNDELSVAHARAQGYRIALQGVDGDALITPPEDDRDYTVINFRCDCADARIMKGTFGGHCEHEIWVEQLFPCDHCGKAMELGKPMTCFGPGMLTFSCPACGNARAFDLVQEERGRRGVGAGKSAVEALSRKVVEG